MQEAKQERKEENKEAKKEEEKGEKEEEQDEKTFCKEVMDIITGNKPVPFSSKEEGKESYIKDRSVNVIGNDRENFFGLYGRINKATRIQRD